MTPMLIFIGIPAAVVVATQAPQIAASSLTGVLAYFRKAAVDIKMGVILIVGGVIGTQLGVLFFNKMRDIGPADTVIVLSYVVLLGGIGLLMLVESIRAVLASGRKREAAPARRAFLVRAAAVQDAVSALRPLHQRHSAAGVVGRAIGFAGAVLGIGGGFIIVPALIYGFRCPRMWSSARRCSRSSCR